MGTLMEISVSDYVLRSNQSLCNLLAERSGAVFNIQVALVPATVEWDPSPVHHAGVGRPESEAADGGRDTAGAACFCERTYGFRFKQVAQTKNIAIRFVTGDENGLLNYYDIDKIIYCVFL